MPLEMRQKIDQTCDNWQSEHNTLVSVFWSQGQVELNCRCLQPTDRGVNTCDKFLKFN